MIILVRVDDRLLHGQIICAWVPFMKADSLLVASDEAAGDSLVSEIIGSCGYKGLNVYVKSIDDAVGRLRGDGSAKERTILIVGDLKDALRIYDMGIRFTSINLGNIHHEDGRRITPYLIVNREDEEILRRFRRMGVSIDVRDVPASPPAEYIPMMEEGRR